LFLMRSCKFRIAADEVWQVRGIGLRDPEAVSEEVLNRVQFETRSTNLPRWPRG
jgi:hypothetical protein